VDVTNCIYLAPRSFVQSVPVPPLVTSHIIPSFILPTSTMKFKGFTVTVNSGPNEGAVGARRLNALNEYPTKDPVQNHTVSAYIASPVGQRFSISVKNECGHDASVVFYVDGQMANVLLCYGRPEYNNVACHGVQPKAGYLRRFIFKKATLTSVWFDNRS
jgi:hypothetical protein